MSLLGLALVLVVGLAGPLLAISKRARIPLVVGEILVGVLVGRTGAGWVDASEPVLTFLATAGFALVMLEVGSHVPLGDASLRGALGRGSLLAAFVGALAVPAGFAVAALAVAHAENELDHAKRDRRAFSQDLILECRPAAAFVGDPMIVTPFAQGEAGELLAAGQAVADMARLEYGALRRSYVRFGEHLASRQGSVADGLISLPRGRASASAKAKR